VGVKAVFLKRLQANGMGSTPFSQYRRTRLGKLRLMKYDNLLCLRRKAFVPSRPARECGRAWREESWTTSDQTNSSVSDITYIRLLEEFVFLAVICAFGRVYDNAKAESFMKTFEIRARRRVVSRY
jgi:hypothetical protein